MSEKLRQQCLAVAPHFLSPFSSAVKRGDRVAQLILERIMTPDVVEVSELDDTTRGAAGYGSTGGHATL